MEARPPAPRLCQGNVRARWFAVAMACAALFIGLTAVEDSRLGARIDRPVESLAFDALGKAPRLLIDGLAGLGAPLTTVLLAAVLAFALSALVSRRLGALSLCLFIALVAVQWVLRQFFIDYPSGHVARVLYVALASARLVTARLRPAAIVAAVALGALMALQRVFTDTHTGTDVVGGALLGGAFGCAFLGFAARWTRMRAGPANSGG